MKCLYRVNLKKYRKAVGILMYLGISRMKIIEIIRRARF